MINGDLEKNYNTLIYSSNSSIFILNQTNFTNNSLNGLNMAMIESLEFYIIDCYFSGNNILNNYFFTLFVQQLTIINFIVQNNFLESGVFICNNEDRQYEFLSIFIKHSIFLNNSGNDFLLSVRSDQIIFENMIISRNLFFGTLVKVINSQSLESLNVNF